MCPCPIHGSCDAMGCTIPPTPRPWRSAAPPWAKLQWLPPCNAIGRPCVPSAMTGMQNGAPPAASFWYARRSSRAVARLLSRGLGSTPHEANPCHEVWGGGQGTRVPGVCPVASGGGPTRRPGAPMAPGTRPAPHHPRPPGRVPGCMTWGRPRTISLAAGRGRPRRAASGAACPTQNCVAAWRHTNSSSLGGH